MNTASTTRRVTQENFYVHGFFASFFRGVLDWFDTKFYTKFATVVIGTYDKAVDYFKKKQTGQLDTHCYPAMCLDPVYDFGNEERAGRFLWEFARYGSTIGCNLHHGIDLKEQDITVTPVFSRYQGTFEITMWFQSVYEMMDLRVNLLQLCGGYGRWLRPDYFWSYLIFPDKISQYKKEDGSPIDWGNTTADIIHIETINQHKLAIPIELNAMWKLDSCADASTKYGADGSADYKMQATFTYEVNLPTYTVLNNMVNSGTEKTSDPPPDLSFHMANSIARYPMVAPSKIIRYVGDHSKENPATQTVYNLFERNFQLYDVLKDNDTPKPYHLPDTILTYPKIPMQRNSIVSGMVKRVNPDTDIDKFDLDKCDILLFDTYHEKYLPLLRRCNGVISLNDNEPSEFYDKVKILRKPCICRIDPSIQSDVLKYVGNPITMDPLRGLIYPGVHRVCISHTDDEITYRLSEQIRKRYPKDYAEAVKSISGVDAFNKCLRITNSIQKQRVIADNCDGITKKFYLKMKISLDSFNHCRIYINDELVNPRDYELTQTNVTFVTPPPPGSKIAIRGIEDKTRSCSLAALYTYEQADVDNGKVIMELPYPVNSTDDFSVVSYTGELELDSEYKFNKENQTVEILIKPLVGELIQIFYYFEFE